MKQNIFSYISFNTQTIALLLLLLASPANKACLEGIERSHGAGDMRATIKDPIIEMSVNFPPPDNPPASSDVKECFREHQGLYNEFVEVIEQQDDCCKIMCNLIYGFDAVTQQALNTFWINKKNIVMLNELDSNMLQALPHPRYAHEPTIVLTYPWKQFSVGTRFKRAPANDTENSYAIMYADFANNRIIYDYVPVENAIYEITQDSQSVRKLFVKIINDLVDRVAQSGSQHVIPYVLGGSSFLFPYIQHEFFKEDGAWQRIKKSDLYAGYDCSEFVMRMAKIAGIPFPWKTTKAMNHSLKAFSTEDMIQDGDLIWIPGHVMILSNRDRNEIVESRSYSSGYGCVHRFTVSECFEGISSCDDLIANYRANKIIRLKNKQGVPYDKSTDFKLLKLVS